MTAMSENYGATTHQLAGRARRYLQQIAVRNETITYKDLAEALALKPPNTILQVTEALEWLMREDAANKHPFIAALVIGRARGGLPAPGFFDLAKEVGCFDGDRSNADAAAWHGAMFAAAVAFWSAAALSETGNAA